MGIENRFHLESQIWSIGSDCLASLRGLGVPRFIDNGLGQRNEKMPVATPDLNVKATTTWPLPTYLVSFPNFQIRVLCWSETLSYKGASSVPFFYV
jgi:hypothetical protein